MTIWSCVWNRCDQNLNLKKRNISKKRKGSGGARGGEGKEICVLNISKRKGSGGARGGEGKEIFYSSTTSKPPFGH